MKRPNVKTFNPIGSRFRPQASSLRPRVRRGFNLVEMLIALGITASLLTATMVSLNASFMAYQSTTEVASTHTIGRLTMHRMLAMIRTGTEFAPFPTSPLETFVEEDFVQFRTPLGEVMEIRWMEDGGDPPGPGNLEDESLYVVMNPGTIDEKWYLLLEGVPAQFDPDTGDRIRPFTLQYSKGRHLYRATIDLTLVPDDNMSVTLDGDSTEVIRLVGSAMPRTAAYNN